MDQDTAGDGPDAALEDRIAAALGDSGFRTDVPEGYRAGFACLVGRPNTGKFDSDERPRGREDRDHLREAADHPPHGPGDRPPRGPPADPRRHAGPPPAADPAGREAERPRGRHPRRGRRHRLLHPGRRAPGTGGPVHRGAASPSSPAAPRSSPSSRTPIRVSSKDEVGAALLRTAQLGEFADVVPVSASSGFQVHTVDAVLAGHLPLSPPLYLDGDLDCGTSPRP